MLMAPEPLTTCQWCLHGLGYLCRKTIFAGAMMVLALKLITAGVSYQDGLKKPEVGPALIFSCAGNLHAESNTLDP
jgi:hypothetical protein